MKNYLTFFITIFIVVFSTFDTDGQNYNCDPVEETEDEGINIEYCKSWGSEVTNCFRFHNLYNAKVVVVFKFAGSDSELRQTINAGDTGPFTSLPPQYKKVIVIIVEFPDY